MRYRKEIDGLRALAVLPVLMFHAGLGVMPGGFVGVDVFFVISGYLITAMIAEQLIKGSFSFGDFYERRARRILPMLFFVMACTLPFAWAWLLPLDFKLFSESLVATPLFASNILFYLTSGYFDTASETKPLIHTWSLAVEEQYYLFFPIILVFAWRAGRRRCAFILGALALASLIAAQGASTRLPALAFYSLPTRAFELLLGAIVSLLTTEPTPAHANSVQQSASLAGLGLVLAAMLGFDQHTPTPSLATLIPTAGAALLLAFAHPTTWTGRLLGSKLAVGVGLISYSAYLWHQPLLALARLKHAEDLSVPARVGLCALSLILAALSWKLIEGPFRDRQRITRGQFLAVILPLGLTLVAVGLIGFKSDGLIGRFPEQARPFVTYYSFDRWYEPLRLNTCHLQDLNLTRHANSCVEDGRPHVALWGDSHASALYPGLNRLQHQYGFGLTQLTAADCPPLPHIEAHTRIHCDAINQHALEALKSHPPDVLILHSAWTNPSFRYTPAQLRQYLAATIETVKTNLPQTHIILVGPTPRWRISPQHSSHRYWTRHPESPVPQRLNDTQDHATEALVQAVARSENVEFISLQAVLCNHEGCLARLGDGLDDFVQVDYGHLSQAGSNYVAAALAPQLAAAWQRGLGR